MCRLLAEDLAQVSDMLRYHMGRKHVLYVPFMLAIIANGIMFFMLCLFI